MFLNNYYGIQAMLFANKNAPFVFTDTGGATKALYAPPSNNSNDVIMSLRMYYANVLLEKQEGKGVVFGTGTVAPKPEDYCISGNVITGLAMTSAETTEIHADHVEKTIVFTITNNNATEVTIGEVAYATYNYGSSTPTSTSASGAYCLIERTVLETPITIEPGGVGQVTYTIRMNYSTV